MERCLYDQTPEYARRKEERAATQRRHAGRTALVALGQRVSADTSDRPKNSMPVIDAALEKGFDIVALDIRVSADGVACLRTTT